MADIIIIVILAAAVVLIIRYLRKQKVAGCSGGCAGCSGCELGKRAAEKQDDRMEKER